MTIELSPDAVRRVQIHAALADPGRLIIVDRLLLADASPSELQTALSMSSSLIGATTLGCLRVRASCAASVPKEIAGVAICS